MEKSWDNYLAEEFIKPYYKTLRLFLDEEYASKSIFPRNDQIFKAFDLCPFDKVKVVILGQDPYHTPGMAHGIAFSVPEGVKFPPSLRNIFKELIQDLGTELPAWGDLSKWAQQGVLLLNATLTVEAHIAGSHQKKGWEEFTDAVVKSIASNKEHVVFLLWGAYAQKKGAFIDRSKHLVLESVHPSPLSASRGFFGNHQFSKTNAYLVEHKQSAVHW